MTGHRALTSRLCTHADFDTAWFRPWRPFFRSHRANHIRLGGTFHHRKEWEFIAISEVLRQGGLLGAGRRGIVFAVGREPLPALFARFGCHILATDQCPGEPGAWHGLWSPGKAALKRPEICDPAVFDSRVAFAHLDMRTIPADVSGFDFAWSCCALEHLGSLQAGLDFIMAQFACLRAGGLALHSLEYNLTSNTHTVTSGPTVAYRRRDIERLATMIRRAGHTLAPVDFRPGCAAEDRFEARPPFHCMASNLAHLRVRLDRFQVTSLLLIMWKGR
jgi:hypothetical protein